MKGNIKGKKSIAPNRAAWRPRSRPPPFLTVGAITRSFHLRSGRGELAERDFYRLKPRWRAMNPPFTPPWVKVTKGLNSTFLPRGAGLCHFFEKNHQTASLPRR